MKIPTRTIMLACAFAVAAFAAPAGAQAHGYYGGYYGPPCCYGPPVYAYPRYYAPRAYYGYPHFYGGYFQPGLPNDHTGYGRSLNRGWYGY